MIRRPSNEVSEVEDEAPVRRSESDAPVRRTRSVEQFVDDDDEETPKARRSIKRGWAAADAVKTSGSSYAQSLKLSEDPIVVKFLEDEPYASYRQHWVERSGQKSWVCIDDMDSKGCPLCEAGNRAAQRFSFNVAVLSPDADPVIKSFDVGPRVIDQLKNFHLDQRQGPLTKHYWAISRTGKGTTSATNLQMVRERDLEDFDLQALSEAELKAFARQAYTDEIIKVPSRKELLDIAEDV